MLQTRQTTREAPRRGRRGAAEDATTDRTAPRLKFSVRDRAARPYIPGVLETIGYDAADGCVLRAVGRRGRRPRSRRARRPRARLGADRGRSASAPRRAAGCWPAWPRTPPRAPCAGDWCVLRSWPDHRTTVERCCRAARRSSGRRRASRPGPGALRQRRPRRRSSSRCTRCRRWPRSSDCWPWPGRAAPDRWCVLTKADLVSDADDVAEDVAAWPRASRWSWSVSVTGEGVDGCRDRLDGPADPGPGRHVRARQVVADQRPGRRRGADHPGDPRRRPRAAHVGPPRAGAAARRGSGHRHPGPARASAWSTRRTASRTRSPTSRSSPRDAASTTARTHASRAARSPPRWTTARCRSADGRAGSDSSASCAG